MKAFLNPIATFLHQVIPRLGLKVQNSKEARKISRSAMARQLVLAFGDKSNIESLDACITRLRIEVKETDNVHPEKLKALGAAGVIEAGNNIQAIFGPRSENLMRDMQEYLAHTGNEVESSRENYLSETGRETETEKSKSNDPDMPQKVSQWLMALGGAANISQVKSCALTRLRLKLKENSIIDEDRLKGEGIEAVIQIDDHLIHLLVGFNADQYAVEMKGQINNS